MTNEELKAALFSRCPVEHNGIVYINMCRALSTATKAASSIFRQNY